MSASDAKKAAARKKANTAEGLDFDAPSKFIELPSGPWERMVPCVVCQMHGTEKLIMNRQGPEHDQDVVCGREHWIELQKLTGRAGSGIDEWWEMTLRAVAGKTEGDGGVDRSRWVR